MISNVELQYVQSTSKNVPYPGDEYARKVINKLSEANDIFKKKYEGKQYSLILSNGEEIHFEVKDRNLSHLLGIDFKSFTSDYMIDHVKKLLGFSQDERMSSYDALKRIIDRADDVIKNDKNIHESKKILNYYKLMIKCSSFSRLSDFEDFNCGFINFDKDIYINQASTFFQPNSNKFIFTESDEALTPYCMMGLIPDNGSSILVPETLISPTGYQDFFNNQELLLPVQILINDDNELTKYVAKASDKVKLLNLYKSILNEHRMKAYINIFNDYESIIRESSIEERSKSLKK